MRCNSWQVCTASVLLMLGLLLPFRAQADNCKVGAVEMPVTMVGKRAVVTVGINGVDVPLMVDTGSFFSFLTDAAAEQLHLPLSYLPFEVRIFGLTGPISTRMTTVKHMQLLKGDIPDVDFVVGGSEMGNGLMGLLGRNFLTSTDVEYDLAHGVIRLMSLEGDCRKTNMAYWATDNSPVVELPLLKDDNPQVPAIKALAKLNGKGIQVTFDSGATSTVSLDVARRVGVAKADMKPAGQFYGVGRDSADSWIARFQKFELGGETVSNFQLEIGDFYRDDLDMLLGVDFFLSHRIYVSKRQRRMYFTYNGGPIFPLDPEIVDATPRDPAAQESPPAELDLSADAYARRGAAAAARSDYAKALSDLDRACELAPQMAGYFVRRGVIHRAMEHSPQALKDFDTALQLEPDNSEALLERAELRSESGNRKGMVADLQALDKTLAAQANQRLQMAHLYWKMGLLELELPQLNLWLASRPNDASRGDALYSRCWTRMLLNIELDKAFDDCDDALDLQSKNPGYLSGRAWVRLRRGEWKKSIADFDRSLKIQPDGAWALYGRGIARKKNGEIEQGAADIDAARKLLPLIDAKAARYGLGADPVPPPPTPAAADKAVPAQAADGDVPG